MEIFYKTIYIKISDRFHILNLAFVSEKLYNTTGRMNIPIGNKVNKMDRNQYENEFGGVPQKPFTERSESAQPYQEQPYQAQPYQEQLPQEQPPQAQPYQEQPRQEQPVYRPQQAPNAYDFNPEKPLMKPQAPPQSAQPMGESFNPVERTASYQNGTFFNQPVQPSDYPQRYPQAYSAPAYPPQVPQQPQPTMPQQPVYEGNPYEYRPQASVPQGSKPPKKKGNKGLIIVVIVLSVLLAGSLAGILTMLLISSGQPQKPSEDVSNGFKVPDSTYPDIFNDIFPKATEPATESHDESDYSNKTVSDFGGLALEKKPEDADENKGYKPDYAFDKVSNSVVGVMCYLDSDHEKLGSQGSGTIFSKDGYVITNAHVIGNSKTLYSIQVVTADGKEYKAGVVGFDSRTDIAVLKMDGADDLTPAAFGDSDEVTVGEDLIVVGNPGGINFQNSMTKGIVSALNRDASNKSLVKYIQTDAAINPGNSGGPAVNMFGQVIGIACSKIADVDYEGMCFAIPSRTVKTIVDSLMKNGYVQNRVKIGISGSAISATEATSYGVPQGILVQNVIEGGPCDGAGIKENDIIIGLDGEDVKSFSDIYAILEKHKDGDKVTLKYYQSETGEEVEEEITLAADKG